MEATEDDRLDQAKAVTRAPPADKDVTTVSNFYRFLVSLSLIACSAGMVVFNKWLMHRDRFPYASALTCLHMTCGFSFAGAVRFVRPDLMPGYDSVVNNDQGIRRTLATTFLPLGICIAGNLFMGNLALCYLSVAVAQMMKEGSVPIVYLMGVCAGLDQFDVCRVAFLIVILTGSVSFVAGEIYFSALGGIIQLGSQFFEVCRITWQSWLMQGSKKIDPLTVLFFKCPFSLATLLCILAYEWDPVIPAKISEFKWALVMNSTLAVALNLVMLLVAQIATPGVYMLVHVVKDMFLVFISSSLLGPPVTVQQVIAAIVVLCGISLHTLYQSNLEFKRKVREFICAEVADVASNSTMVGEDHGKAPATGVAVDDAEHFLNQDRTETAVSGTELPDNSGQLRHKSSPMRKVKAQIAQLRFPPQTERKQWSESTTFPALIGHSSLEGDR